MYLKTITKITGWKEFKGKILYNYNKGTENIAEKILALTLGVGGNPPDSAPVNEWR